MAKRYRKTSQVVEAIQLTVRSRQECLNLCEEHDTFITSDGTLMIATLDGDMYAEMGDYIVKGPDGKCYPCDPVVFERNFEAI